MIGVDCRAVVCFPVSAYCCCNISLHAGFLFGDLLCLLSCWICPRRVLFETCGILFPLSKLHTIVFFRTCCGTLYELQYLRSLEPQTSLMRRSAGAYWWKLQSYPTNKHAGRVVSWGTPCIVMKTEGHSRQLPVAAGGTGRRRSPANQTQCVRGTMSTLCVFLVVLCALIWATPSTAQLHKMPVDNLYKLFSSVEKEVNPELSLPVEGVIPAYVAGSLFKNGFGKFGASLRVPSELQGLSCESFLSFDSSDLLSDYFITIRSSSRGRRAGAGVRLPLPL